ncbi:hypothetical protein [Aliivibrio fischeri]|uniref:hypothetical protein n=1 Tax=Aliivibrio fischeri TaxID=668 RepID=UPI00080DA69F|nr:hypothetical protein [Aliivibrio fischeri]OCH06576.1 hypothetical protein A6E11_17405 [Aliivibrio fischeri]
MKFSNKDRKVHLFHYNENNEFTHDGIMTIRAHMGLPALCTVKELPAYDPEIEKCYFIGGEWIKTELFIGRSYWDESTNEMVIKSFSESLPENYSFIEPPKPKKGFAVRLVNNQWKQLEDHRGKITFAKDRDNDEKGDYQVEELGALPDTHTLLEPEQFDSWDVELSAWKYDKARYRIHWINLETHWQQDVLTNVEAELLFYAQDMQIPELYSELRKTNYTENDYYSLLGDRILLNEYVEQDDFPECGRPKLSGLVPD